MRLAAVWGCFCSDVASASGVKPKMSHPDLKRRWGALLVPVWGLSPRRLVRTRYLTAVLLFSSPPHLHDLHLSAPMHSAAQWQRQTRGCSHCNMREHASLLLRAKTPETDPAVRWGTAELTLGGLGSFARCRQKRSRHVSLLALSGFCIFVRDKALLCSGTSGLYLYWGKVLVCLPPV